MTTLTIGGFETEQARATVEQTAAGITAWRADLRDGTSIALAPELSELMTKVLEGLARGGAVRVSTLPSELTTSIAANELGISRPTLMKKIHSGEIPAHKVGSHTRVKTADVLAFKKSQLARQRKTLEDLLKLEDQIERDHG